MWVLGIWFSFICSRLGGLGFVFSNKVPKCLTMKFLVQLMSFGGLVNKDEIMGPFVSALDSESDDDEFDADDFGEVCISRPLGTLWFTVACKAMADL